MLPRSNGRNRRPGALRQASSDNVRLRRMNTMPAVIEAEEAAEEHEQHHHDAHHDHGPSSFLEEDSEMMPSIDDGAVSESGSMTSGTRSFSVGPSASGTCTPSGRSSYDRQIMMTRHVNSLMKSGSSKELSKALLTDLAMADEPIPLDPWCHKCASLKPFAILPLRPEEVDPTNVARLRSLEINKRLAKQARRRSRFKTTDTDESDSSSIIGTSVGDGRGSPAGPSSNSIEMFKRIEVFVTRMKVPITKPFFQNHSPLEEVAEIILSDALQPSRFSAKPCESGLPVLRRLTQNQVGMLELWMISHIKSQYIRVSAASHALAPKEEKRHRLGMTFATLRALLKRDHKELREDEKKYLLSKLATLPLLRDVPEKLLLKLVFKIQVVSLASGVEIFREGDPANDLYIVVQGQAELRSDTSSMLQDQLRESPSALLVDDVLVKEVCGRPFTIKPDAERVWSRSAVTQLSDVDATTMVDLLLVPYAMLQAVADHFRYEEYRDRNDLVRDFFAPSMRMNPALCLKHCGIFALETFTRNHVLVMSGTQPVKTSKLYLVLEGEVQLLFPAGKVKENGVRKTQREAVTCGRLVGDCALWGERYGYSGVVSTEQVKVLSCEIGDYLEKLLRRSEFLERRAEVAKTDADAGASETVADAPPRVEDLARSLFEKRKKALRHKDDLAAVKAIWRLGPKDVARRAPPGGGPPGVQHEQQKEQQLQQQHHHAVSASVREGAWPSTPRAGSSMATAQTPRNMQERYGAGASPLPWLDRPTAAASGNLTRWMLDRRVDQAKVARDRIVAAHRSHVRYNYHEEDALAGSQWVPGIDVAGSPAVLMAISAISPQLPPASARVHR
mmetsp:Transcript_23220/g.78633  ORF Transcript_23220/g.78633 Transcript_23220/m.78633 type:complete len:845 (+) Transcript_23220:195-2729(+)